MIKIGKCKNQCANIDPIGYKYVGNYNTLNDVYKAIERINKQYIAEGCTGCMRDVEEVEG